MQKNITKRNYYSKNLNLLIPYKKDFQIKAQNFDDRSTIKIDNKESLKNRIFFKKNLNIMGDFNV